MILWNEEWKSRKFGIDSRYQNCKRTVPEYILLLFLHPHRIVAAKRKELHNLYSRLGLLRFFKSALTKTDPAKKFTLLHASPARALCSIAHYKMLIFIVRVHLAMRFCLCISFEEVCHQIGGGESLEQKCMQCLEKLEEAIMNSAKREEPEEELRTSKKHACEWAQPTEVMKANEKTRETPRTTVATESGRKRKRREDDSDIDGLVLKCDRLLNNFSQMQDNLKAVEQLVVSQKEKNQEEELDQNLFKRMKRLLVKEVDLRSEESSSS